MMSLIATAASSSVIVDPSAFELGRGAIAGAFIVAAAFFAGYAAIRRSGLAVCALLMIVGAAALEFSWLGFFPSLQGDFVVLILGLFAAASIIFLSASVGAAKYNALLGGVMFTAALIIAGMGVINFIDRVEIAPLMRWSVIAIGGFAVVLALTQAVRGDGGARLILPGVVIALAAPLVGPLGVAGVEGFSLAPHGMFTIGVLAASLVALADGGVAPRAAASSFADQDMLNTYSESEFDEREPVEQHHASASNRESTEIVLDSQLARVLDYAGVAIWDWGPDFIDQTESLAELLGADSTAPFTPEALRNFIHKDDIARFEDEVLSPVDGPFDVALKLFDGRKVRLRGARAARGDNSDGLERIVAFVETASPIFKPSENSGVNRSQVKKATEAAIIPAALSPGAAKFVDALDKGKVSAAFQPIVALNDKKVVGYEALARWRRDGDGDAEGPEEFLKAAEQAGKGAILSDTMLEQAASYLAERIKKEKRDDLFAAMNVSWGQMRDPEFAEKVKAKISKYSLPKNALLLELTEGDAVSDHHDAGKVFKALKNAGAALAFDDFGAGFSCLSNLRKYDFDYLKIDKSFSADLASGGDGAKIVRSLAELGGTLGLKVIVEGIESDEAADEAKKMGCAYAQGFALGKPAEMKAPKNGAVAKLVGKLPKTNDDVAFDEEDDEIELAQITVDNSSTDKPKKNGRWTLWRREELR